MFQRLLLFIGLLSVLVAGLPALAGEEAVAPETGTVEPTPDAPACPGKGCGGCGMGRGHGVGMAAAGASEDAAGSMRCCKGCGGGGSGGRGAGRGGMKHDEDHQGFFFLLDNRDRIRREVTKIDKGVETLTESDDPEVAAKIREHVAAMYERIEEGRPIHMRDPLFAEIFQHAEKIRMETEPTEKGICVRELSDDPEVIELIQAHAEVVSQFIENGHAELHRDHPVP